MQPHAVRSSVGCVISTFVSHDDGDRQFLLAEMAKSTQDGRVVGLGSIVDGDPTLLELWDLPLGWVATRTEVAEPWVRAPS